MTFPIGYDQIHPDVSMNFQMNRFFGWVGEEAMLEELRAIAAWIGNYADWKRELLALAGRASREGHVLRAGYHYRSAEFFMMPGDPDRENPCAELTEVKWPTKAVTRKARIA